MQNQFAAILRLGLLVSVDLGNEHAPVAHQQMIKSFEQTSVQLRIHGSNNGKHD